MSVIEELQQTAWTLREGVEVVRLLQQHTRQFGYHLTLGGGVLNKGYSKKDLDLFFLPLDDGTGTRPHELLLWLEKILGPSTPLIGMGYSPQKYSMKVKFDLRGKRIDAFIS